MADNSKVIIKTKLDDTDLKAGLAKLGSTVKNGLATAGKVLAGVTATAAAGAVAITKFATDTATAADRVDKTSQRIGMSFEAFQEWDYILGQCGGSIDNLEVGMKTMVSVMDGAANGNSTYIATLQRLYDESGVLIDTTASQEEQFNQVVSALQNVSNETTRAALASDMFGRAGVDMIPMLNSGADAVDALRDRAHELGYVMTDETVLAGVAMGDAVDDMKTALTGLMNSAMAPVLPLFTDLAQGLAGVIAGSEGATDQLKGALMGAVQGFSQVIKDNLPFILDLGMDLILSLVDGLIQAIPELTACLPDLIVKLVEGIITLAPNLLTAGWELIKALALGIGKAAMLLFDAFVEYVWEPLVKWFVEKAVAMQQCGKDFITGITDGIKAAAAKVKEWFQKWVWDPITKWIPEKISEMKNMGKNIIDGLINGIKEFASKPIEAIKNVGANMVNGFKNFFGIHSPSKLMMSMGEYIDSGLAQGIMTQSGVVISASDALALGISEVFVVLAEDGTQMGAAVSDAIADGIAMKGEVVTSTSQTLADAVKRQWDGMKLGQTLDISSLLKKFSEGKEAGISASQMVDEAWASAASNLQTCCLNAFSSMTSGFSAVGEALVNGEDAWGAMGKAALLALAQILEGIGAQLAGLAVVNAIAFNWVSAALATAGSIAAYIAAGAVRAWANSFAGGGIVGQQSGVPTTGDHTQVWVNPGELILNASQQDGLLTTMSALATYGQYRQEQQSVDMAGMATAIYNAVTDAMASVGVNVKVAPAGVSIDGRKFAQIIWPDFADEADRRGISLA